LRFFSISASSRAIPGAAHLPTPTVLPTLAADLTYPFPVDKRSVSSSLKSSTLAKYSGVQIVFINNLSPQQLNVSKRDRSLILLDHPAGHTNSPLKDTQL
jgi:hypothetical protein